MFTERARAHIGFFAHCAAKKLHSTVQANEICRVIIVVAIAALFNLQLYKATDSWIALCLRASFSHVRVKKVRRSVMAQLRCNSLLYKIFRWISRETTEFSRSMGRWLIIVWAQTWKETLVAQVSEHRGVGDISYAQILLLSCQSTTFLFWILWCYRESWCDYFASFCLWWDQLRIISIWYNIYFTRDVWLLDQYLLVYVQCLLLSVGSLRHAS